MGYKNRVQLSANYTTCPLQSHLLYVKYRFQLFLKARINSIQLKMVKSVTTYLGSSFPFFSGIIRLQILFFQEFVSLMKKKRADDEFNDDIEQAFKVFDTNNDG